MVLLGFDPSGLDPRSIDPRIVGLFAAIVNLSAYMYAELVSEGHLSKADADRGFDDAVAEIEHLIGRPHKAEG
jgi:hypothetical protein